MEAVRNESAVQTAIRIKPGIPVSVGAVDEGERTAISTLPSGCTATEEIAPFNPMPMKTAVQTAVALSGQFGCGRALTVVNPPPMSTLHPLVRRTANREIHSGRRRV